MRKIVLALGALALIGFTLPLAGPANAEENTVVVKRHHHDWDRDRHHHKTVIIKHGRDHRDNDHDHD